MRLFCGIVLAVLALMPVGAFSQGLVQGGAVTPGHAARWVTPGVLGDAGGAGGSQLQGSGYLSEIGITNTGTPFAINDALISSQGGYHTLSFGANSLGGGLINYQSYAGAQPLPLQICTNGQCVQFPFNLTGVQGPGISVIGDLACWNNASGTLLRDCGPPACPPITAYGGKGDNATDNTAALAATLAAQGPRACVSFPPGEFFFASNQSINVPSGGSLMIQGAGQEISLLRFPSGVSGISITLNTRTSTSHVRDLSFLAGGPPQIPATGLAFTQAVTEIGSVAMQSDVENVTFRGSDGYAQTNGWQNDVSILDVTNINFINDDFFGTLAGYNGTETAGVGIFAVGYTSLTTQVAAQFNVVGSTFEFLNIGIAYNFNVQGFAIANSTFVLNNYGLYTDTNPLDKAALQFVGNNCNNYKACVQDNTTAGIPFAIYTDNIIFLQQNSLGLSVVGNNTIIAHNNFWGGTINNPSSIAILVGPASGVSNAAPTIVESNTIGQQSGSAMGIGIKMDIYSQNVRVANNMIDPTTVTVPIANATQIFGNLNFVTGSPTNITAQQVSNAVSNVVSGSQSVSAASPAVVSWTAHGFSAGQGFRFTSVGSLTGISTGVTYYVSQFGLTANSFEFTATFAGTPVNTGGSTSTVGISTYPNLTRLTVPSTAGFITGAYITVNGLVGVPCNFVSTVRVVDATHLDMTTCLFAGAYTSGGTVSTLP